MKSRAKNAVQAQASSSVGLVDDAIDRLFNEISPLITAARERVAIGVNTELTKLNWNVGNCINREILERGRAEYGKQVVKGLASRLILFHGSGWDEKTLRHCLRAAETFGEREIVSAARRSRTRADSPSQRRRCIPRAKRAAKQAQCGVRGDHPRASRFNPQGDVRTAGIWQRQEGGGRRGARFGVIFA